MNMNSNETKTNCNHKCQAAVEPSPASRPTFSNADTNAERSERILRRTIIIGSVLIMVLVAVVFYLKFAALGKSDDSSTLQIQSITRY